MNFILSVVCVLIICISIHNQTSAITLPHLSSPDDSGCKLNFTSFPYKPTGSCNNNTFNETLEDWNGFSQKSCCQNALIVFSNALALHARQDSTHNIFLPKDQWNNCGGPFKTQPQVSAQNCGFGDFYYGNGNCSELEYTSINRTVIEKCSSFGNSLFDDACSDCLSAISDEVSNLAPGGNASDKAICVVALVVSVLAENFNNDTSTVDDFNRCLPGLALPGSQDYIKIKYGTAEVISSLLLVMTAFALVIMLIKFVTKNRYKDTQHNYKDIPVSYSGLYRFSKAEIENAINFGSEKKFLGRGSAGQVFKGVLPSGQIVAIKQIYKNNTSDSFTREIVGLSKARHKNLVILFGCCIEDGEQYLVYEYCSNGNLGQQLLKKDTALTWVKRVKILRDCALGLRYLHNHPDGCIVHRDIKLTNILLNQDMDPKLSDFGLARLIGIEESKVFTDVRGTIGYMDPEYMSNAKLTCASDVYSFGIVTLQLLSGQRVIELDLDARDQLTRKAKDVNMHKRPIQDFQDPNMKGEVITVDFESILQLAVLCVSSSSAGRPTMDLVCDELEKTYSNTLFETKRREKNFGMGSPSISQEFLCV